MPERSFARSESTARKDPLKRRRKRQADGLCRKDFAVGFYDLPCPFLRPDLLHARSGPDDAGAQLCPKRIRERLNATAQGHKKAVTRAARRTRRPRFFLKPKTMLP